VNTAFGGSIMEVDNNTSTFGGVGNLTALRSLYEEYRIDAIKFTFIPLFSQSVNLAGGNAAGQVTYAINRSPDAALPTRFTDILRQNDCKVFNTNRGFAVTIRKPMWSVTDPLTEDVTPSFLIQNFATEPKHAWCSTRDFASLVSQPTWYGMDFAIENAAATTPIYRLMKTFYISFRSQN
jgi:hypothetical protein